MFIQDLRSLEQGRIEGTVNFIKYENYTKLVNFIERANSLRFQYIIPYEEPQTYYRDVQIESVSKSEIQPNGVMSESISFNCLSLWYQEDVTPYEFGDQDIVWDFVWDPYFADYKSRTILFNNDGHTEAPFQVIISGYIEYPTISVSVGNEVVNSITFPFILQQGESLEYSSKETELYIRKKNKDGSYTNLFTSQYIDINNQNIFTLPKGESVLTVSAENEIFDGEVNIYKRFKVV